MVSVLINISQLKEIANLLRILGDVVLATLSIIEIIRSYINKQ